MRIASRMLALAALLVCTACAEKSTTTNSSLTAAPRQEFSSVRWEDAISANQSAVVSNGKLILMR